MPIETKDFKLIKYRSGIMHKGYLDGIDYVEYEYEYIKASVKCTKRYNNALCLLMGINGCPHHLIEWLSENMTDGGYVNNNKITRRAFIGFHAKWKKEGNKEYSEHAVIKAFKKLTEEGFLISIDKGTYQINPLMYFANSEEDRIRSIKYMMEFKAGVETKVTVEINRK